jgi:hypothetical protein
MIKVIFIYLICAPTTISYYCNTCLLPERIIKSRLYDHSCISDIHFNVLQQGLAGGLAGGVRGFIFQNPLLPISYSNATFDLCLLK